MTLRDELSPMAQRRYDIELKRLSAAHGAELGLIKTERLAARWLGKG